MPTWILALLMVGLCIGASVSAAGLTVYVLVYRGAKPAQAMPAADAEQYIIDINRAAREAMLADAMRRTQQPWPPTIDGRWS